MEINWLDEHAERELYENLDNMVECEYGMIRLKNIPSSEICSLLGIEVTDRNGWQVDWWGKFQYKHCNFSVSGTAWYGTVDIEIESDIDID